MLGNGNDLHVNFVEFTGHLLSDRDTTSSTGMGAGVNGNSQWEWEGNGNKTNLNFGLGMGMGINYWEYEGMGLKKIFLLISNRGRSLQVTMPRSQYSHNFRPIISVRRTQLPVKHIGVARILSGVQFFPKKLTTFLVIALKDRANIPPNLIHQAKTVLKFTLAVAGGCTSCPRGVHFHIFPVN